MPEREECFCDKCEALRAAYVFIAERVIGWNGHPEAAAEVLGLIDDALDGPVGIAGGTRRPRRIAVRSWTGLSERRGPGDPG